MRLIRICTAWVLILRQPENGWSFYADGYGVQSVNETKKPHLPCSWFLCMAVAWRCGIVKSVGNATQAA